MDAKLEERLGGLSTPPLIILGENGFIIWPSESAELQKAFQAWEIVLVPHSGHFLYIEQPDVFFTVTHDWLST